MAGYSGKPLAGKLGIDVATRLAVVGAPPGFPATLAAPKGVTIAPPSKGAVYDVIVFFTKEAKLLRSGWKKLTSQMDADGALWIAWPKKASKVHTDMTEDVVREVLLPEGLVDNKVCAIDETWSGLRMVWRKELRAEKRVTSGASPKAGASRPRAATRRSPR